VRLRLLVEVRREQAVERRAGAQEHHRLEEHHHQRDEAEHRVHVEDDGGVDQHEQTVDHRRHRLARHDLADRAVRLDAHHQVTRRAALEERERQRHHVVEEAERHLGVERDAQVQQQVRAHDLGHQVEQRHAADRDQADVEQVVVRPRHDLVDDHARHQRHRETDEPQEQRHHDDAREQALLAHQLADVAAKPALLGLGLREAIGRRQLDRDAGEALAELGDRDVARAGRGIDDADAALHQLVEHHEVVELPVQDRRGLQQLDLRDVDLDAAAGEAVALGGVEDRLRRHAVAADAHRFTALGELHLAAVIAHDHAERGGAAIGPLELLDERNAALAVEAELLQGGKASANVFLLGLCHGRWCPWLRRRSGLGYSGKYFSRAGSRLTRNGLLCSFTSVSACMPW
jgi:hypothetical protein